MVFKTIQPDKSIALFVKNIWTFDESQKVQKTALPFFADGCPGLLFGETENGLVVHPHGKQMPLLFLYGQTLQPIELHMQGRYKLIVFQLYPFVLKSFFNVEAKDINDGCHDLQNTEIDPAVMENLLRSNSKNRVDLLSRFLLERFEAKKERLDFTVKQAIQIMFAHSGQITVSHLCKCIHLTQRTFERRFLKETGISPKQFLLIIRFQNSFQQLSLKEHTKLTDIVYANGFADQSHFIRVFKGFTGKTPKHFLSPES